MIPFKTLPIQILGISERRRTDLSELLISHHLPKSPNYSHIKESGTVYIKARLPSLGEGNLLLLPVTRNGAPRLGAFKKMTTRSMLASPPSPESTVFVATVPPQQPSTTAAAKSFLQDINPTHLLLISVILIIFSIAILSIALFILLKKHRGRKVEDDQLSQEELGSPLYERKTISPTSTAPPSFSRKDSNSSVVLKGYKKTGREVEEWPALFGGGDAPLHAGLSRSSSVNTTSPYLNQSPPAQMGTRTKKNAIMNTRELEAADEAFLIQLPVPLEREKGYFNSQKYGGKAYLADVGRKKSLLELELMKERIAMERVGKWRELLLKTEQDSIEVGSTIEPLPRGRTANVSVAKNLSRKENRSQDDFKPKKAVRIQASSPIVRRTPYQ